MGQRKAVTKVSTTYKRGSRPRRFESSASWSNSPGGIGTMPALPCGGAGRIKAVAPRADRPAKFSPAVVTAFATCWVLCRCPAASDWPRCRPPSFRRHLEGVGGVDLGGDIAAQVQIAAGLIGRRCSLFEDCRSPVRAADAGRPISFGWPVPLPSILSTPVACIHLPSVARQEESLTSGRTG
jgi:hypothetical protein